MLLPLDCANITGTLSRGLPGVVTVDPVRTIFPSGAGTPERIVLRCAGPLSRRHRPARGADRRLCLAGMDPAHVAPAESRPVRPLRHPRRSRLEARRADDSRESAERRGPRPGSDRRTAPATPRPARPGQARSRRQRGRRSGAAARPERPPQARVGPGQTSPSAHRQPGKHGRSVRVRRWRHRLGSGCLKRRQS